MLISMLANLRANGQPQPVPHPSYWFSETFSGESGNRTWLVVSRHQIDFFAACLQILQSQPLFSKETQRKKRTVARVGGEALMVAPWPLCAMAQVIFQGLDSVSTKPTIELSRSHLQSRGRAIFHPATSPCPRKYCQAHRVQGSQQHQRRWKPHKSCHLVRWCLFWK